MEEKPIPCPSCGGMPSLFVRFHKTLLAEKLYKYSCPNCFLGSSIWYRSQEKALKMWNRRNAIKRFY